VARLGGMNKEIPKGPLDAGPWSGSEDQRFNHESASVSNMGGDQGGSYTVCYQLVICMICC